MKNFKISLFLLIILYGNSLFGSQFIFIDGIEKLKKKQNVSYKILISNHPFDEKIKYGSNNQALKVSGCRGEIKSMKVKIVARKDIQDLTMYANDFSFFGSKNSSPIDIRTIKWWYQGAGNIRTKQHKVYLPELLLKDSKLIKVDRLNNKNYIRSTDTNGRESYLECSGQTSENLKKLRPVDTKVLQPVDLRKNKMQEYWINIKIPDDAKAGRYITTIQVLAKNTEIQNIPFVLEVYPFDLQPSTLMYSIYYRAKLSPNGEPTIGSEYKSVEQYERELLNMKEHGVLYPTNYEKNTTRLGRILDMRKRVNLPTDAFFNLGLGTGNAKDSKQLAILQQSVKNWIEMLHMYEYKDIYFYGKDEARGKRLLSQKKAWQIVQKAGGKNFVATYNKEIDNTIRYLGSLLDAPILARRVDPLYSKKWHSVGSKVFSYANPQVGEEEPEKYRRNYGLVLLKAEYDGAMDYAYQHGFHHIWNDFDHPKYRDHVFAYPTINGVVDTIAWEGFREGTYDVRYAATFLDAIENATDEKLAQKAKWWYNRIDPSKDNLDKIRTEMAKWILELKM